MAKIRRAEENDTLKMTSLSSKPLEALSESEKIELTEQQQGLDEIYKRKGWGNVC